MPAVIEKRGSKWVVLSHKGKGGRVLGTHPSRTAAVKQQQAVNAGLQRKGKI